MKDKLIIAHRGASAYEKDNSIDSFTKAIKMGADMIEFDVRQSSDGILIAHHDPTLQLKHIGNMTYDQIKHIDSDIPTVENVLKLTLGKIRLDIELKEAGYEKEIVNLALQYFGIDDFIVTSFVSDCIKTIKKYHPKIKTGLILGRHQFIKALLTKIRSGLPAKWARSLGADYLALDYRLASNKVLKLAKQNNLNIMVWTINDRQNIQRFLSHDNIFGIITNYPDTAVEMREVTDE